MLDSIGEDRSPHENIWGMHVFDKQINVFKKQATAMAPVARIIRSISKESHSIILLFVASVVGRRRKKKSVIRIPSSRDATVSIPKLLSRFVNFALLLSSMV